MALCAQTGTFVTICCQISSDRKEKERTRGKLGADLLSRDMCMWGGTVWGQRWAGRTVTLHNEFLA